MSQGINGLFHDPTRGCAARGGKPEISVNKGKKPQSGLPGNSRSHRLQPAEDGGDLEGTPGEARFAHIKYDDPP